MKASIKGLKQKGAVHCSPVCVSYLIVIVYISFVYDFCSFHVDCFCFGLNCKHTHTSKQENNKKLTRKQSKSKKKNCFLE